MSSHSRSFVISSFRYTWANGIHYFLHWMEMVYQLCCQIEWNSICSSCPTPTHIFPTDSEVTRCFNLISIGICLPPSACVRSAGGCSCRYNVYFTHCYNMLAPSTMFWVRIPNTHRQRHSKNRMAQHKVADNNTTTHSFVLTSYRRNDDVFLAVSRQIQPNSIFQTDKFHPYSWIRQ